MSKDASAWFPFYVGDYLGDTQRLTTEQHGAYILLILDYWRGGPPPDDDSVLQQITKLSPAAWRKHRPAIARMFQIIDGVWRHKRVEKELAGAIANAERRSSKARAAAEARWGSAAGNAPSMPQAELGECPPPSPSPSPVGDTDDDGGDASASASDAAGQWDAIHLTDELCRVAGVRHVDPGPIGRHQAVVREWLAEGFDPETEIIPAIRQAVSIATERITSLAYFANPVRQFRARKEAHAHGFEPSRQSSGGGSDGAGSLLGAVAERRAGRLARG